MKKDIIIILPFKESLKPESAGAVSLYVNDTTSCSKYKNRIQIISSDNYNNKNLLFRNKNYIVNFCKSYQKNEIKLIEIHNRPEYLKYIKEYFPNSHINLVFHNDPLGLRGSVSIKDRQNIINSCHKIIFISSWIQQRFFSSFKNVDISTSTIISHGVKKKKNITTKNKKKNILFVGKLNKAKGYDIFVNAATKFKKKNSDWNFIAIGNENRKNIFPNEGIIKEVGYKKNSEVLDYYMKSEIAVGNSIWEEPLGRIAIEASSRKCLPIISNKAGLAESKHIAIVLKKNNPDELYKVLKNVTSDTSFRRKKQNLFFKNNDFDIKIISNKLDYLREEIINKTKIKKKINNVNKKVLHIANFNENSDGRLYYSFANKLNNGFIKNDYIVQTISDRVFLKSNRSLFQPFYSNKKFNIKVLNTLKNFSPQLLLLGHVFSLSSEIFEYCRNNNIKICSWYIDSISPEFLKDNTKKKFFYNLKNVDNCFITSSPEIFKKNIYYKKLKFIPNPVDSSIDNYKNFLNSKNMKYDIFLALSHGQNRGILKKGKSDEREKFIKKLINNLPQLKFAQFGLNNFEPIWGANYYHYLSKSKMAINISRGKYKNKYSSDRISSLIGNGLLVFLNENTQFQDLLSSKDVVYFKNENDLLRKINYYNDHMKDGLKIAKSGHTKYHKYMSNKIVSKYIMSCIGLDNVKKPFWSLLK